MCYLLAAPKHFNMGPFIPNLYALRIDIVIFAIDIHYLNMILLLEIETYMQYKDFRGQYKY